MEPRIIDYKVVSSERTATRTDTALRLARQAKDLIDDGYTPYGHLAATIETVYQAFVKYEGRQS